MEEKELSNLYIDVSQEILNKISFDSSLHDQHNQLLFLICVENSLLHLADSIHKIFNKDIEPIDSLGFKFKWIKLQEVNAIKNITKINTI